MSTSPKALRRRIAMPTSAQGASSAASEVAEWQGRREAVRWTGAVTLMAALLLLPFGVAGFRSHVRKTLSSSEPRNATLPAADTCYSAVSVRSNADAPLLGQHLEPVGPIGDPWFANEAMTAYTGCCIAVLILCCVSAHAEFSNHEPRSTTDALRGTVLAWMISIAFVATTFAPLPISRLLTFVGLSHNVVEGALVYVLLSAAGALREPRRAERAKALLIAWLSIELLGSVVLGSIEAQWVVFGVMGACTDVALLVCTIRFFRASPTREERNTRAHLLRAVSLHVTYVTLHFANCAAVPPTMKVAGLAFNCAASLCATRFMEVFA
jgi:hypothetical protein